MQSNARLILIASVLALAASACGGDPIEGTWSQPNGTITIPPPLGPLTLSDDATLVFDDTVSPTTFNLSMDLGLMGLSDTLQAKGTYTDTGDGLTLKFTGFVIAAGSTDTMMTSDGMQCVTLNEIAGAPVCFQTPQSNSYTVSGDTLAVSVSYTIVGGSAQTTTLNMTKSK